MLFVDTFLHENITLEHRIFVPGCQMKEKMVSQSNISNEPKQAMLDQRVLVVGLGRFGGGVGVTRWLVQQGAKVTVTDLAPADSLKESIQEISDLDVTLQLGGHDLDVLDETDLVILNPAVVKKRSELFTALEQRNIPFTTEMNLFCERCSAMVIGITGSYGKSTTSAMLDQVLRACLQKGDVTFTDVHLGGNIGRSLLTDLHRIKPTDLVVLEMSNAQLEDLPRIDWSPHIAVVTNIHPHHLERYDDFESYIKVKLNIIGSTKHTRKLIVGECDPVARKLLDQHVSNLTISVEKIVKPLNPIELHIPGKHNQANADCVIAIAQQLKLNQEIVCESLRSFRGLPHRLEIVEQINGVDYINDSKSTSPAATESAIQSMDKPLVMIVGGQDKEKVSLDECAQSLLKHSRAVICMGESGFRWYQTLQKALAGRPAVLNPPRCHQVKTLVEAVHLAKQESRKGDAVLFSPGAASFDAYPNFVERGEHFKRVVRM